MSDARPPRPPSLLRSVVASVSGFIGSPLRFLGGSLLVSLGLVGVLLMSAQQSLAVLAFGPLLGPLGSGLLRMAGADARGMVVTFRDFAEGVTERLWPKLGLGALQIVLLLAAGFNVALALGFEGMFGAMLTAVAVYILLAVWTLSVAIWPLVADPLREHQGVRDRMRLGVRSFFVRPLQLAGAAILCGAMLLAGLAFITPLLFVPGLSALLAAHLVLPLADRLDPLPEPE